MIKAVILARGLGKRMRLSDPSAGLGKGQAQSADAGMKAMIPIGRPFLDYVLSPLADSGIREVCLVIGPEHAAIREHYQSLSLRRIQIRFAIQEKPIGTANALLSAKSFAGGDPFMVLNSDNYYPVEVFRALRELGEPGLPAFERESLLREGNMPRERVLQYALLRIDAAGYLQEILEKPGAMPQNDAARDIFISMNCWRFDASIFRACERVPRSSRGEFELPEAVQFGITSLGLRFKTVPFHTGVLDLSNRSDIASVAQRLAGLSVEL
ncbi:MAG TPA: nucleotidyltransferase family protein [Candidatus Acidoferrales bacterium]|nr:nucleotidyltransferase family protein [Candidatus Acidoferrales bacterium]